MGGSNIHRAGGPGRPVPRRGETGNRQHAASAMTASAASPGPTTPVVVFSAVVIALVAEIVSAEGVDSAEAASAVVSVAVGVESGGHDLCNQHRQFSTCPLGFEHRYAA